MATTKNQTITNNLFERSNVLYASFKRKFDALISLASRLIPHQPAGHRMDYDKEILMSLTKRVSTSSQNLAVFDHYFCNFLSVTNLRRSFDLKHSEINTGELELF